MQTQFNKLLDTSGEYGEVIAVRHPLVEIAGLPHAHVRELVMFEDGSEGEVFLLGKDRLHVMVFSTHPIKVGTKVTRTNAVSSVPAGEDVLGHVIDPLGRMFSQKDTPLQSAERQYLEVPPLGLGQRRKISKEFLTGVTIVDMMVPLGKGQKELIIGDRKTGKSAFLLATIKNQVKLGAIAIYCCIAKKKSDIKKIELFLKSEELLDFCAIVATTAFDSPGLIYLTPYSAMAIAEYFRDQGKDVIVVLDDLSTHAKFYRELSLLANRFPGRDSYPGDIFYTHARLLERSGNYAHPSGKEVSITVLPVAEIVEGDFTGYIATNLMGMTDGHIYFDSNIYYQGRRPAVNILLSVTRVGRQAQSAVLRSVNRELTSFFALYEKMQNLSHFGAELTDSVINVLKTGELLYAMFNQPYTTVVPSEVQVILFSLLWLKFFDTLTPSQLATYRASLLSAYTTPSTQRLFQEIVKVETFNQLLTNVSKHKDELLRLCQMQTKP